MKRKNHTNDKEESMHTYRYLALGDSYTIGESIPMHENLPYQLVQQLRKKQYHFEAPEIIARTGWTTDELDEAMKHYQFLPKYDVVSVLIGVNNQYKGRDAIQYKEQLEELLKKAIELAGGKKDRVFILSIPDYSNSPFAEKMDKGKISKEIDVFNGINKALSIQYKVQYLDITTEGRSATDDAARFASDGLHPSAQLYAKWAQKFAEAIAGQLK